MTLKKPRKIFAESLMSVDSRGRLVLDYKAMIESGVMNRQFRAARKLHRILEEQKNRQANKLV